ncbi:hypothetical protein [Pedobacter metabolipauper]|nr:hypothetical protein [Pedobacter metabolipauper]
MNIQDTLSLAADTLTEKTKQVEITIRPKNWLHKYLIKKGFMKSTKIFEITPILVGNRKRVSSIAVRLPKDSWDNGILNTMKAWKAVDDHTDHFIYVVAVCIENRKAEPSKALIEELRWMPDPEFMKLMDASLTMAGLPNFMKSIVWISGQSVLNVPEPENTVKPAKEQD